MKFNQSDQNYINLIIANKQLYIASLTVNYFCYFQKVKEKGIAQSISNPCPCGLYYKTITISIMTIVSDATIWSFTYNRNC